MIQESNRSRPVEGRDEPGSSFETACRFGEHQRSALLSLDHRLRNNLGALLTLIEMTKRQTRDVDEFAASISAKVRVMAAAYGLFSRSNFRSVDLHELIRSIAPFGAQDRIEIDGADVEVPMRQAFALGLVISTLLVHSERSGALSEHHGGVHVHVSIEPADEGKQALELHFDESSGAASPLSNADVQLLQGLVKFELRGELRSEYEPHGASHHVRVMLDSIEQES